MAKLTKFKAQQVEFPTHYKVEDTNRGDTKIKNIIPAFGTIRENGTPETEEIYNGLQLGNVHTLQANKTTNLNIDYYVCNLEGLTEFGVNNDLKLRINVDTKNTNSTTKLRLNNIDYTLLKEYNGTLKQIEAGDFKPNKSYELAYNGNQFVVINITEFGTETDTVLEGKRLSEIIGLEFGGNIQDTGAKVTGKFYYDKALKYYYECIANNNLTYNDGSKFRAISNKPILDKLENLHRNGNNYVEFPSGLIFQWGSVRENVNATGEIIFPKPFKNSCFGVFFNDDAEGFTDGILKGIPRDKTKFSWYCNRTTNITATAPGLFTWFAIGV